MTSNATSTYPPQTPIAQIDSEQLPIPRNRRHGIGHFFGLYGAEHIAATEFVFGATFVMLGASFWDIIFGLLVGNALAVLSFWLITARIATDVRLSLYTYLDRIAGGSVSRLYNAANTLIFAVISAAMITVSATAVTAQLDLPPQVMAYPTDIWFVVTVIAVALVVVLVAYYGFDILTEFASICAPWLGVMFVAGGIVLLPALAQSVLGSTVVTWDVFVELGSTTIFTGTNVDGEPGIGFWEVAGFAWAANSFAHFGLIDMALLRYARKSWYGIASSAGMMYGHYFAWIAAGIMGAAVAALSKTSITMLDPGIVAFQALAWSGFVIVIVAGWTTANSNLYRAGLAAQAVFPNYSRAKVTIAVGIAVVVAACFPFVYKSMMPLLTYAGILLVPVGGIVFAEHYVLPKMGCTRYWARFKGLSNNVPALLTWALSIGFAVLLEVVDIMPYFYHFIPTWLFAIVCYSLLARAFGAGEDFSAQKAEEHEFDRQVDVFQHRQAEVEGQHDLPADKSPATLAIRAVWMVVGLLVPLTLAFNVLWGSPDYAIYEGNLALFKTVAIWCTAIYFIFAYWGLRRQKAHYAAAHH